MKVQVTDWRSLESVAVRPQESHFGAVSLDEYLTIVFMGSSCLLLNYATAPAAKVLSLGFLEGPAVVRGQREVERLGLDVAG